MKTWQNILVTSALVLFLFLIVGINIYLMKRSGLDIFKKYIFQPHTVAASSDASFASTTQKITEDEKDVIPCTHRAINKKLIPVDLSSKTGLISVINEGTYDINGSTWGQISYQLLKCTPMANYLDDGGASAITNSQINWSYTFTAAGNQACNIQHVAVGLRIHTLFPNLISDPTIISSTTLTRWNTFITNTRTHESIHADISKKYAQEVFSYLTMLSTNHGCVDSAQSLENELQKIVSSANYDNAKYDFDTKHGETQGAIF